MISSQSVKALLVYPEMPDTFWSMKHFVRIIGKKSSYPPLGLMTVSRLLPSMWEKKLVDLNVSSLSKKDILWADYVFISAMNVQIQSVKEVIALCKKHGATIVAGGPLFTHEYEKFPEVDHCILNEAEITLPEFIADLHNGTPKKVYTSANFADVKHSPLPDWSLINPNHYAYAIVQYSRGCPYLCDFCDVTALFGRNPRIKSSDQIIGELNQILETGSPHVILFADDNLIGNKKDLKNNLLPALINWRRSHRDAPGFVTQVTINLADDDELMRLMIEAGFRDIFIGIESTSADSLKSCKKTQNLRRSMFDNIKKLHAAGFIVTGGFIVGFDTDDETIFDSQIDFIQQSGIVLSTVNILKAPPGTELHDRLKREHRLIEPFDFDENRTNIKTTMDFQTLYTGYKKILDAVYHPKYIFERSLVFLSEYGNHTSENPIRRKFSFVDVMIFLKINIFIGLHHRIGKYYWKIMLRTFFHRRKNILHALRVGLFLYQFHHLHKKFLDTYSEVMLHRA